MTAAHRLGQGLVAVLVGAAVLLAGCGQRAAVAPRPQAPSPLAQWALVVVGADATTSQREPTPIFDNARRDVAQALLNVGFNRQNLVQLSVNPNNEPGVAETTPQNFLQMAPAVAQRSAGCVFYFTSHGNQQGLVFGRYGAMLDPASLNNMLNGWCANRPTIVIISACYSGVFAYPLAAPNRMIMTAARGDRSSFGCGGTDRYPYFDECVLNSIPGSVNFLQLADVTRQCVAQREQQTGSQPPSEPQVLIGDQVRQVLSQTPFVDGRGQ
jgi:hypothetical protein